MSNIHDRYEPTHNREDPGSTKSGIYLLVEDRLGLTTVTHLLVVVSSLTLNTE